MPKIRLNILLLALADPDLPVSLDTLLAAAETAKDRMTVFRAALHSPDSLTNNNVSEPALADLPDYAQARG